MTNEKVFKAKKDGYQYKKGDILKLIQKANDGCSFYQLKDGTEVYALDDNLEACQPKFSKGDHVRIIGNSTKNCEHYADIGTTGIVEVGEYSEDEIVYVRCDDCGIEQYIGAQDLELIQENNSTPKSKCAYCNKQNRMKIRQDKQEIFCGSLKECVEKITGRTEILVEVRSYIKMNGYCAIIMGKDDEYSIIE